MDAFAYSDFDMQMDGLQADIEDLQMQNDIAQSNRANPSGNDSGALWTCASPNTVECNPATPQRTPIRFVCTKTDRTPHWSYAFDTHAVQIDNRRQWTYTNAHNGTAAFSVDNWQISWDMHNGNASWWDQGKRAATGECHWRHWRH
jgi:hypothetical protein